VARSRRGTALHSSAVYDPLIIEARPSSARERMRQRLRGRRIMLSGILALIEVIAFIVWRPSAVLLATLAVLVLVASVMAATRVRAGLLRDLLWIVAIAQAMVVVIPLVVGLSLVAGLIAAIVLIVGIVLIAVRWRV
jgi:hypothetical protein